MSESLTDLLNNTLKQEFSGDKASTAKLAVRGALERVTSIDAEIRRTINRVTNRAQRADMIGAVDPDDIKEGLDHLMTALNAINAAWDSFESAADVWGVTPDEVAEIANAAGGRITEPLPQPGTFIKGDGEVEVELRQLAENKFLIIAPDARTEYIGSIDTATSIYDTARYRAYQAIKETRPEDVPGFPHK